MSSRHALIVAVALGMIAGYAGAAEKNSLLKGFEESEAQVRAKLESSIWKDEKRKRELLECLQAAGTLKAPSLLPLLLEHMTYDAIGDEDTIHLVGVSRRYPAMGAVSQYNVSAIRALLEVIKRADVTDESPQQEQLRRRLVIACIQDIYGGGRIGRRFARNRIEQEVLESTGREKARLESALRLPELRD
jgi:hypothetical protein